ncbi:MAG: hypothetical protein MUE63_05095 [Xanthomonadales bacterium]|jgi:hypothetical protein|nr:hypothetical protein [Xanthomonadales bacterium]
MSKVDMNSRAAQRRKRPLRRAAEWGMGFANELQAGIGLNSWRTAK